VTDAAGIRVATVADVASLEVLRRAWAGERHGADAVVDEGFADRFGAWFAQEARQRTFWLAERSDGQPVGMVNLLTFHRMPTAGRPGGRWGYLGNLYVRPEQRGGGLGARLVQALLAAADADGLERVVLSPSERSVPLYRRAGFGAADQLLLRPGPGTGTHPSVVSSP
jgi:GNAT superfamily N-acetyltransferase